MNPIFLEQESCLSYWHTKIDFITFLQNLATVKQREQLATLMLVMPMEYVIAKQMLKVTNVTLVLMASTTSQLVQVGGTNIFATQWDIKYLLFQCHQHQSQQPLQPQHQSQQPQHLVSLIKPVKQKLFSSNLML